MHKVVILVGIVFLLILTAAGVLGVSNIKFEREMIGSVSSDKAANLGIELLDASAVAGDPKQIPIITFVNQKNDKLLKIEIICIEKCDNVERIDAVTVLNRGQRQTINLLLASKSVVGVTHPLLRIEARWKNSYLITQRQVTIKVIEPTPIPDLPVEDGRNSVVCTPPPKGGFP